MQFPDADLAELMTRNPPEPIDRRVFQTQSAGNLTYSRWAGMTLPKTVDPGSATKRLRRARGHYGYRPFLDSATEWYVNLASRDLFGFYGSSRFAQDEIQAAEHPALGALNEALIAEGVCTTTVGNGDPTPVTVKGVERRCRVAAFPGSAAGRPSGLYGNASARASSQAVRRATSRIDPPTVTNIIAMAAPRHCSGRYTVEQIEFVLRAAFTGFCAAALESIRQHVSAPPTVVHTGFWGCGALGGNRTLMAALQILAAEMAGLDWLVFYTCDTHGMRPLNDAVLFVSWLSRQQIPRVDDLIREIAARGFEWGVCEGNFEFC